MCFSKLCHPSQKCHQLAFLCTTETRNPLDNLFSVCSSTHFIHTIVLRLEALLKFLPFIYWLVQMCAFIPCIVFESLMFLLILRFQISPASPVRVCPDPSHLALTDLLSSFEAFIWPMMYCMPCLWSSVQFMEFISHSKASWISGGITVLWGPSAVCGILTMINPWLRGFTSTMGFQMHEEAMCFSSQRYICLWLSE